MDTALLTPAIEDHYREAADYLEKVENAGFQTLAEAYLEALDQLEGRPLRLLMVDIVQVMGFPQGINGTSLAYIHLAGCIHKGISLEEMEGGPRFQELGTLAITEDYHPSMAVAKDVVRAVCKASVIVGHPGPAQEMTLPNGTVMKTIFPTTYEDYNEALKEELNVMWGDVFDLEEILKNSDAIR